MSRPRLTSEEVAARFEVKQGTQPISDLAISAVARLLLARVERRRAADATNTTYRSATK